MKTFILLSAGVLILSLSSCKKNHTCICTGNSDDNADNELILSIKDNDANAAATCKSKMATYADCRLVE